MANTMDFKKQVVLALITGAGIIIAAAIPFTRNNSDTKLITKETIETRSPDGTITKRETENYR